MVLVFMEKVRGCIFIFFLIVLLSGLVSSLDDIDNFADSVDGKLENVTSTIENTKNTLTDADMRDEYLKKQWISVLENKPVFRQIISSYRIISPYTNPIIEYTIGMAPELSFFFVLILVIWFFLVKYFFTVYEVIKDLSDFSSLYSFVISVSVFAILIILQFFQIISVFFANKIVGLIEFLTSQAMKIVAFFIFVVIIVFLSKFSKKVKVFARYIRMRNYKRKKEHDEKEISERRERATERIEEVARNIN